MLQAQRTSNDPRTRGFCPAFTRPGELGRFRFAAAVAAAHGQPDKAALYDLDAGLQIYQLSGAGHSIHYAATITRPGEVNPCAFYVFTETAPPAAPTREAIAATIAARNPSAGGQDKTAQRTAYEKLMAVKVPHETRADLARATYEKIRAAGRRSLQGDSK
jgi:hypothetical protein